MSLIYTIAIVAALFLALVGLRAYQKIERLERDKQELENTLTVRGTNHAELQAKLTREVNGLKSKLVETSELATERLLDANFEGNRVARLTTLMSMVHQELSLKGPYAKDRETRTWLMSLREKIGNRAATLCKETDHCKVDFIPTYIPAGIPDSLFSRRLSYLNYLPSYLAKSFDKDKFVSVHNGTDRTIPTGIPVYVDGIAYDKAYLPANATIDFIGELKLLKLKDGMGLTGTRIAEVLIEENGESTSIEVNVELKPTETCHFEYYANFDVRGIDVSVLTDSRTGNIRLHGKDVGNKKLIGYTVEQY